MGGKDRHGARVQVLGLDFLMTQEVALNLQFSVSNFHFLKLILMQVKLGAEFIKLKVKKVGVGCGANYCHNQYALLFYELWNFLLNHICIIDMKI